MIIIITCITVCLSISVAAQDPPPPPNNGFGDPNVNNTPVGGGAPLESGLIVLLAMGATYGGKKMYQLKSSNKKF